MLLQRKHGLNSGCRYVYGHTFEQLIQLSNQSVSNQNVNKNVCNRVYFKTQSNSLFSYNVRFITPTSKH